MKIDTLIENINLSDSFELIEMNEFELLKENIRKFMNNDKIFFHDVEQRYIRYINKIENWLEYEYLKNDINEFLNENDLETKKKLMIKIDMTLFRFLQ
jgi:hypothetical protein